MKQPFVNATIVSKKKGSEAQTHGILSRTDRNEATHFEKRDPTPRVQSDPVQVGVVGARRKTPKQDQSADVKGLLGKAMKENNVNDVLAYFKLKSLP